LELGEGFSKIGRAMMERHGIFSAPGTLALWVAAGALAVLCVPQLHADETGSLGTSARPAQSGPPPEPPVAKGQDDQTVQILERELAAKKSDLEVLLKLLPQEGERASRLEQDLAAARREVETQTALARKAGEEAAQLEQTTEKGSAELRQSLQQERDKTAALEQELSSARAAIYANDAQVRQASDEAAKLKEAAKTAEELKHSLQQEHERAGRLEQDLAAARRDLETQTALATRASSDASQQKKTAEASAAELRKSLQQENERATRLEQDLVAARREAETQTALASKAGEETAQLKQAADKGSAELRQSLYHEPDKAEIPAQVPSNARAAIYANDAQASQPGNQGAHVERRTESSDLRKSLVQEWEREARLQQQLAEARRDVETQNALVATLREEANHLKKEAGRGAADRRLSLQQEQIRPNRPEQDVVTAPRDFGIARGTKAGADATPAQSTTWTTYTIPETGTSTDLPSSIFTEKAGRPDGYGQRFKTTDGRATLTIQAAPNTSKDSPAAFLEKRHPPAHVQYERITSRFFALSSYKDDKVWYDRCNFSGGLIHCVLMNYPAKEERRWDDIVTRISLSLRGK
jgi:hypothetical protein